MELNIEKYQWENQRKVMEENVIILTYKTKDLVDLFHRTCKETDAMKGELTVLTDMVERFNSVNGINEKVF